MKTCNSWSFAYYYYILHTTYNYWKADINYNIARNLNRSNKPEEAIIEINKALLTSANESIYLYELAFADTKVETANKALKLTPIIKMLENAN